MGSVNIFKTALDGLNLDVVGCTFELLELDHVESMTTTYMAYENFYFKLPTEKIIREGQGQVLAFAGVSTGAEYSNRSVITNIMTTTFSVRNQTNISMGGTLKFRGNISIGGASIAQENWGDVAFKDGLVKFGSVQVSPSGTTIKKWDASAWAMLVLQNNP